MALLGEYPQGYWEGNQFVLPTIAPLQQTVPPIPVAAAAPPVSPLLRVRPLLAQPDDQQWDPNDPTDPNYIDPNVPNYTAPRGDWAGELDVGGYGGRYPFSGTPYTKSGLTSLLRTGGGLLGGSIGGLLGAGIGSAIDVYGADELLGMQSYGGSSGDVPQLLGQYAHGYSPTGLSWGDAFINATPLGWFGMGKSVEDQIAEIFSYRGDDPHQLIQDPSYDAILGSLYEAPPWVDPDIHPETGLPYRQRTAVPEEEPFEWREQDVTYGPVVVSPGQGPDEAAGLGWDSGYDTATWSM